MVLAAAPKAISDAAKEQKPQATPDLCAREGQRIGSGVDVRRGFRPPSLHKLSAISEKPIVRAQGRQRFFVSVRPVLQSLAEDCTSGAIRVGAFVPRGCVAVGCYQRKEK